jgi:hypothetical protein
MKKALAYLLLLIYFTASTGFIISSHYCMDKFDSVRFGNAESDTCGKCGMHQGENKCCFDDVQVLKLNKSHLASQVEIPDFSLPEPVSFSSDFLLTALFNAGTENKDYLVHIPPLISDQKVYLANCVFRI